MLSPLFFTSRQRIKASTGRPRLSLEALERRELLAVTVTIDYSLDINNFFDTTEKQDLLQSAADSIASRFGDDLDAIAPSGGDTWSSVFFHPATGASHTVVNPTIAADELLVYAGGRDLGGSLGQGGPGGFSASGSSSWLTTVATRGETGASLAIPVDFGPWGGAISFDTQTDWHFGATTSGLATTENDFYSVALHELSHLFGFGTSNSWSTYVDSTTGTFTGINASSQYDGSGNVPLNSSEGHWASDTFDGLQEAAMDPSLTVGSRKLMTLLDLAGLADVGWEIDLSEPAQTKLNSNDFERSDWFGYAVDIDGDWAVVGAPLDDDVFGTSGSAYVFHFDSSGEWIQHTKLNPADPGPIDEFGWSVSISGDTIVVGSWLEDTLGANSGAAYVFQRDHGGQDNWGQVTKLAGSDTTAVDKFGFDVAISGDTIVVGAEHDDAPANASGAAYVFDRDEGGADQWGQVAKLVGSDSAAADLFGYSVDIDADRIVVGARLHDVGATNDGAAYVYDRDAGGANNWGEVAKLTASDGAANDQFGYSVAVSCDRVVVGARLDDVGRSNSGSVYVFDKDLGGTDNWGEMAKISAHDPTPGAWFGASISLHDDNLLVGATYAQINGVDDVGAGYHYWRHQGGPDAWGNIEKLTADDGGRNDRYGTDVSISGARGLMGAPLDDPDAVINAGSIYVHTLNPGIGEPASLFGEFLVAEPLVADNHAEPLAAIPQTDGFDVALSVRGGFDFAYRDGLRLRASGIATNHDQIPAEVIDEVLAVDDDEWSRSAKRTVRTNMPDAGTEMDNALLLADALAEENDLFA